jgi:OOP family OmpA-OmpF porin
MRFTKLLCLIGLPVAVALAPAVAQARPGLYFGGSWGAYSINDDDFDEKDDMLKGFVGLQFNDWFGLEASRVDFNRTDNSDAEGNFEGDGNGLAAVINFPLGTNSAIFVKGGQFWWDAHVSIGGFDEDADGDDAFFGGGLKLGLSEHVALRLEVERYDLDTDVDTASVGVQFQF